MDNGINGKSAKENMISVSLERYEGLITRLAQLEGDNANYKVMLESAEMKQKRKSWLARLFRKATDETN